MNVTNIFKDKVINGYLESYHYDNIPDFFKKWEIFCKWKKSCEIKNIHKTKETSVQGLFLNQIFGEILGYKTAVDAEFEYNQIQEFKSIFDTSESDGALGFFTSIDKNDVRVVIELKDSNTNLDKKQNRSNHLTPVEQGFMYAHKNGTKCGWVIVSNFVETRLYKSNSFLEYETFSIYNMDNKEYFKKFYFMLCKENLISKEGNSLIDNIYIENQKQQDEITNLFYEEYKLIRNKLWISIKNSNPKESELLLFEKTQKLMDRMTFICFCEDCGLLPDNTIKQIIDTAKNSFNCSDTRIWNELKNLFISIDKGNPPMKINHYNGGLFKEDIVLDNLIIKDDFLEQFEVLSKYDFKSQLNVNILGHIFEQSISDVDEIKKELLLDTVEKHNKKGKQKSDGIYYTPYYVTRYIVKNTVGKYLNEQKNNIKQNLLKTPYKASVLNRITKRNNTITLKHWEEIPEEVQVKYNVLDLYRKISSDEEKAHLHRDAVKCLHYDFWCKYEEVLKNIKILDPTVGSGAFLNHCFDYLHEEMVYMLDMKYSFDKQYSIFDIDKQILQNNLYGVDINAESVEITKLSLWLKTAKKDQTLASLDNNIKCGNSLICDESIAEELAFNWKNEFSEIMEKGGFDIIIGNPPYGASIDEATKKYIAENYKTTEGRYDTYKTFFELGFKLLKENGYLGYITPNTFLVLENGASKLRDVLFRENSLINLVELFNVFKTATVEPIISIFKKTKPKIDNTFEVLTLPRKTILSNTFEMEGNSSIFTQLDIIENENLIFNYRQSILEAALLNKIKKSSIPLFKIFDVFQGIIPYGKGEGKPKQTDDIVKTKPFTGYTKIDDTWKPFIRGKKVNRYLDMWDGEHIKYGAHLCRPRNPNIFVNEKIFIRQTSDYPVCTLDKTGKFSNDTLHCICYKKDDATKNISLEYLLGVINSKLIKWVFQQENFTIVNQPFAQTKVIFVERLPIKYLENYAKDVENMVNNLLNKYQNQYFNSQMFIKYIKEIYSLKKITEKMDEFYNFNFSEFYSELKKKGVKLKPNQQMELMELFDVKKQEWQLLNNEIIILENKLDQLIYKIYNLTSEEIDIIESTVLQLGMTG